MYEKTSRQRLREKVLYARRLRQRMTKVELILWEALRSRKCAGWKFRRQAAMGPFIVDFISRERRLVIELDGDIHEDQSAYDREREEELRFHGYRILRFWNDSVLKRLPYVLGRIVKVGTVNPSSAVSPSPGWNEGRIGEGVGG